MIDIILGMYLGSYLGLMLEQSWALWMDTLMVLMMESLRDY